MFNLSPVPVPDLSGKTILVTGAGKGIGAELVRVLHAKGARVYAGVHAADTIENHPDGVTALPLDVTNQEDVDAVVARIAKEAGRLDALVNNAGTISTIAPLAALPIDALARALDVNVLGVHRMSMAALPLLRVARGRIINAGTGAATMPMEGWAAYCTSKAGMQMLTRMMAMELADDGIKTFFLGIPPTDTAMQDKIRLSGLNPISRIPQEKLVPIAVPASCMAWLCSADAAGLEEVLLDVRQDVFTRMMDLQGTA
jgi:NAD(P)-dependent dehydrogenase (short-subunit alcohol dehydrogenase family)